tara:strand:+ start:232 stop:483 length:252 start_codon:yes stop_codon:yes gene_type:complete
MGTENMKIGDRVKYVSNTIVYGTIISTIEPKCRCKGKRKFVVKFDDLNEQTVVMESNKKLLLAEYIRFDLPTHRLLKIKQKNK